MWTLIQNQVLGMRWLSVLTGHLLEKLGLDITGKIGGSIQFFIYDVIKIVVLLCTLIFIISYIQSFFPPERTKKILGRFHGIGAIIHNWIPQDLIVRFLGNGNPFGVIIATIAGVPMYADIFGCIPIAEALLAKGARLGVVLSFMMGVTTLSLPSMIMLKKAIKPKLLGVFAVICTVGIIVVGYLFNAIQYMLI